MGMYNSEPSEACASAASVSQALAVLNLHSTLAIACQGWNLGLQSGSACLLSFATIERPSKVYHFDLITLSTAELQPVFTILRSTHVLKVLFDGRMLATALLHEHNVALVNTLDMQIAYIASRTANGEGQAGRLHRLAQFEFPVSRNIGSRGYVPRTVISAHPEWYQDIHRLNEVEDCALEYNLSVGSSSWRRQIEHTQEVWGAVPHSTWAIKYATDRVYLVSVIYTYFLSRGFITPSLASQSARYFSLYRASKPTKENDHGYPFLPLYILSDPEPSNDIRTCLSCSRGFPEAGFYPDAWLSETAHYCKVCFGGIKAGEEEEREKKRFAAMPPADDDCESEYDEFW